MTACWRLAGYSLFCQWISSVARAGLSVWSLHCALRVRVSPTIKNMYVKWLIIACRWLRTGAGPEVPHVAWMFEPCRMTYVQSSTPQRAVFSAHCLRAHWKCYFKKRAYKHDLWHHKQRRPEAPHSTNTECGPEVSDVGDILCPAATLKK